MQNDILCTRWPPTASCEIRWLWTPREHTVTFKRAVWVSALHQRTDTGSSNSKVGGVVQTWLVLKSLKCARKLSPVSSHWLQPGPLMRGRVEPRFHVVCLTFGLYHQSATADMDTLQRRCFLSMICLTLVSLGEYCLLFLAVRSCTRCALHAFRCSSAYVGCNERWFDLLSPSNQSSLVVSLLASTNRFQRTAARWMFSAFLCNSWKVRAARLGPPTMLCSRSLTSRFFPFLIRLVFSR